jgi:hypothetical protein
MQFVQPWRSKHSPQFLFSDTHTKQHGGRIIGCYVLNFASSLLTLSICHNAFSVSTSDKNTRTIEKIGSISHSVTHGAEPFLRSCQLCSHSRTSQYFMEPEGSLPRSQEPSTGPCPEPDRSNPYHTYLSKIHFNIVQLPMSWSSQWFLSFWISHQYPICIPLLRHSCYMPCPSHNWEVSLKKGSLHQKAYYWFESWTTSCVQKRCDASTWSCTSTPQYSLMAYFTESLEGPHSHFKFAATVCCDWGVNVCENVDRILPPFNPFYTPSRTCTKCMSDLHTWTRIKLIIHESSFQSTLFVYQLSKRS